jgi:RNA polymerase sigma-70 factor, ECF subfamily
MAPKLPGPRAGSARDLDRLADEELMELVQRGEAQAFEVIYDRHSRAAFSLAYRMCGGRSAAEDVTQEAFLAMWRSGGRFDRTRGSVRTWALGIVHNRAVDALRRTTVQDRHRAVDEGLGERLEAPERTDDEALRRQDAGALRAMLAELPPEQSRVIQLAYFGGFTNVEIAHMLDTPLGTVKGRMRLGLERLRGRLEGVELSEALP